MSGGSRLRQAAGVVLKLAVTTLVVVFIIHKLGWRHIVEAVTGADPWWVAAALGAFFMSGALGALQWRILLANRGISLTYARAFVLYFVGMFFNNFIFGMVAGDAVRITYLRLGNESGRAGFAATFLDRFAGFWAMSGFAVVGSMLLIAGRGVSGDLWYVIVVLLCMFAVFAGVMGFLVSRVLQKFAFAVLEALPVPGKERVRGVLEGMLLEAHDMHILGPVAVLAVVVQLLRVFVHILCAAALGLVSGATIHYFFIFVPILAITMVAPLPFGVRESIEGYLFTMAGAGIGAAEAVVMGFLASLVGIAVSMVGAVFFVAGRRHIKKEIQ